MSSRLHTDISVAKRIVEDFESFEDHEMPLWSQQREVELVRWAFRCLANPRNDYSRDVLEALATELEKEAKP